MLLVLLSGIGIWRFSRNRAEASLPPIEVVPLVGLPGFESEPAFSPDGNQVAFSISSAEEFRDLHDGGRGREVAAPNKQFWRLLSEVVTGWPTGRFSPLL